MKEQYRELTSSELQNVDGAGYGSAALTGGAAGAAGAGFASYIGVSLAFGPVAAVVIGGAALGALAHHFFAQK